MNDIWGSAWQNLQNGMCTKQRDQPGHLPSLIRVFAVRMKKAWVLSYPLSAQQRLWSDWADVQADLSLHWAHAPFCRFCHALAQIHSDFGHFYVSPCIKLHYQLIIPCYEWHFLFDSDEDKKELYKGFLSDMSECLEEMKSVSLRKKPGDVTVTFAKISSHYIRHRIDLLRGKWILKVR